MNDGSFSNTTAAALHTQRLDKWLWHARFVKTRPLTVRLITVGHVRVNKIKALAPAKLIRIGDVLTIALDTHLHVIRIMGLAERRESFTKASQLYQHIETN